MDQLNEDRPPFYECNGTIMREKLLSLRGYSSVQPPFDLYNCASELCHRITKPTKWLVCPADPAWRSLGSLATHWAHSEVSAQIGLLIWVFARCFQQFVLLCCGACICITSLIWATSWQNQQNGMCAQRRLRSAWASAQSDQSSLSVWRKLGSLATHWTHSEDSDQTGRMPRLIWVFAGRTVIWLVLSCAGSFMATFILAYWTSSFLIQKMFVFSVLFLTRSPGCKALFARVTFMWH